MRTALLVAALGVASSAVAQMPLPPFGNTYTANATRGFWFQAPTSFVITGLAVPNEALQTFQAIEVIDLGAGPPPAYPGTVTGTQLYYSNNTPAGSIVPVSIPITAGSHIGILGVCTASVGAPLSYNSYTAQLGPFQSDILGNPTTITRFGTQFGIGAGGNQPCWQEAAFNVSRIEVYVTPAGPGVATNTPLGAGCLRQFGSWYEEFATSAAFDLANTGISMLPTGTSYLALPAITTYVPPSAAATVLTLSDDSETTVSLSSPFPYAGGVTSSLTVCSNGYVSVATGNGVGYTPAVATFLNAPQTGWWNQHDYNPAAAGGGQVKFEQVGPVAYITWDGVWDFGGSSAANANTFQFQFDTASGQVHLWFQTMSSLGNARFVGYSGGGPSANPGPIDISAVLPSTFTFYANDVLPLTLTAQTRPITGTSWNLTTSDIPATGVLGVEILGLTDPGLNDLTVLGMPGCGLRASLDLLTAYPVTGATHATSLAIPNNAAFVGLSLFTSAAVFQVPAVNSFGAITSNGIQGLLGNQ
jgi:hypothetical protein